MVFAREDAKARLLRKIVDPEYNDRIVQWIHWNCLAKTYPDKWRVERLRGNHDFVLLQWHVEQCMWIIFKVCEEFKPRAYLRLVEMKKERV